MNRRGETSVKEDSKSVERGAERREVVIINRPFVSPQQRCDRCAEPSGMITPDEAAALCRVSTRTVTAGLKRVRFIFPKRLGKDSSSVSSLAATTKNEVSRYVSPEN